MKQQKIKSLLEDISSRAVPENTDLKPDIFRELGVNDSASGRQSLRLSASAILLSIVLVLVLATAVFAAYRLWLDPGLQGVKEAGLGSDLNVTAQPTLNPEVSDGYQSLPATMIEQIQNIGDVKISLDWISANQMRVMVGFSATGLQAGMSFDKPQVDFHGATTQQYRGAMLSQSEGEVISGVYISYQWLDVMALGETMSIGIDLPLVQTVDGQKVLLGTVHFELSDIPTNSGEPTPGQQSYATNVNGHAIQLEWIAFTSSQTTAILCFEKPDTTQDWRLEGVTGRLMDVTGLPSEQPVASENIEKAEDQDGLGCELVKLPLGFASTRDIFQLSIGELKSASETLNGPWDFNILLPGEGPTLGLAQGVAASTPISTPVSTGELGATLKWAYADSSRVVLEVQFFGWQENYGMGMITVKDDSGMDVNTGYGTYGAEDDPSTQMIILQPDNMDLLGTGQVSLHLDIPVVSPDHWEKPLASFHFDMVLPVYQAREMAINQRVTANGLEMMLVKAAVTPSYTELTICYRKPTSGDWSDWMLGNSSVLQSSENETRMDSAGMLYDSDFGGYVGKDTPPAGLPMMNPGRCMVAGYPLGDSAKAGPFTFKYTVYELERMEMNTDEQLQAAIAQLKTEGIEISVVSSSGSGGGGGGATINAKPEGMSDEEVYHRLEEALGNIYAGPWVFTVQIP